MTKQAKYETFIAGIDNSVAGSDFYGNLSEHVACSAEGNACDAADGINDPEGWYAVALSTAEMIVDDWTSFYPELIK